MLVCAVLAALTVGVLIAYGVCILMFHIFRIHARQVALLRRREVSVGAALEG
jgi:uncharacterized protein (DUF2062 family)